ncbi:Glycosyltransferase involved in cell wall bisynthesis [Hydrobacter penzbergensis]|uniref:Glycosyltransferase involved in cell wall bisynthesis n=1 Tax=Hydrobacter penzbergensis TaxID=1235997 RepID=A0A8X8LDW3_9BACT|nr:glycosyltransferase [Hydrobacter penzbergensis]SDW70720.1 Glycosyltransferase involved in cell wall bisynthesis [Hydrobacter penzbergensis]
MRIAVNRFSQAGQQPATYHHYIEQLFRRLSLDRPAEEFVFIDEKHNNPPQLQPGLWVKQPADASMRTTIPQILIADDWVVPGSFFRKWLVPLKLRKAKQVITLSAFVKDKLENEYRIPASQIAVLPGAPDPLLQPADWQQKETIKAAYADGREYFLVSGGMYHDTLLLNLLKAFSQFKKWQHSNMKLIITGTVSKQHAGLAEKLATYKYREDVVLTGLLPAAVNTRLIMAAYALVHTTAPCASELIMLDAMQAGIPVIAAEDNNLPETGGDAVLYADPANPETIGKQMLALYKDENLRGQYIEKGKEKAAQFSWATTAAAFWQLLVS